MALIVIEARPASRERWLHGYVFTLYLVPKHQDTLLRISGHYWTKQCLEQRIVR